MSSTPTFREIDRMFRSRNDKDFELEDPRKDFVIRTRKMMYGCLALGNPVTTSDVMLLVRHGLRYLPVDDIEATNNVGFGGKMFELGLKKKSGDPFFNDVIAKLHDTSVIRSNQGEMWEDMIKRFSAAKGELARKAAEDAKERQKQKLLRREQSRSAIRGQMSRGALCILAAVWCGILAYADFNNDWIYQLSRWALCTVAVLYAFRLKKADNLKWAVLFATMAVIHNPLAPIRFSSREWERVDIGTACFLLVFVWFFRKTELEISAPPVTN